MSRGITEETVRILNPLPKDVTDEVVLKRAGLDDTATPHNINPLRFEWHYGSGAAELEYLVLEPGDSQPLRESDAEQFLKAHKERGAVKVALDATPEQIETATKQGLQAAITFWGDRGSKRLHAIKRIHNYDAATMEEMKHDFWTFHYAQAICDILKERLRKPVAKKATTTKTR